MPKTKLVLCLWVYTKKSVDLWQVFVGQCDQCVEVPGILDVWEKVPQITFFPPFLCITWRLNQQVSKRAARAISLSQKGIDFETALVCVPYKQKLLGIQKTSAENQKRTSRVQRYLSDSTTPLTQYLLEYKCNGNKPWFVMQRNWHNSIQANFAPIFRTLLDRCLVNQHLCRLNLIFVMLPFFADMFRPHVIYCLLGKLWLGMHLKDAIP